MRKFDLVLRNDWLRTLRLGVFAVAASAFLGGLQASAEEPEEAPASPPPAVEADAPEASMLPAPEAARTRGMPPPLERVPDPDDLQRVPDPDDLDASGPETGDHGKPDNGPRTTRQSAERKELRAQCKSQGARR